MKFSTEYSKPRLAALIIVMSLLSACATASSEPVIGVCPPVVEYSLAEQASAADAIEPLLDRAAIVEMQTDYVMIREQLTACSMGTYQ